MKPIESRLAPCCCGCHHEFDKDGHFVPFHHPDSTPPGFCEACGCEKCREIKLKHVLEADPMHRMPFDPDEEVG